MMKGTNKTSEKVKTRTLYDEDGNPVKGYRVVEEESDVGESYEHGQGPRDTSQRYEYAKAGRDWHSWADVSEWIAQHKDDADYNGDYQEERDEGRWVDRTGKGKVRSSRGQSRPPTARVRRRRRRRMCTTTSRSHLRVVELRITHPLRVKDQKDQKVRSGTSRSRSALPLVEVQHRRVRQVAVFRSVRCHLELPRVRSLRGKRARTWI